VDVWPGSPQNETALVGVMLGVAAGAVAVVASSDGAWPVILLAVVPLLVRGAWRTMPLWLLLLTTTVPIMVAESMQDQPTSATWLIGCVALVVASIDRRHAVEWVPVALVVAGPLLLAISGTTNYAGSITAIWMMGLLLSATGGTIVGQQRRLVTTMREAQVTLAAAAAADERHRIAGEVHDLVGHSFSVVLLHLAGARHLMGTDPQRAEDALRLAEEVGRQSMNDLRASLALLRSGDRSDAPVDGLEGLPRLVDGMRQAGLDVSYSSRGDLDRVDAAVGVVLHGIAREALTNAAKHAADGPVSCELVVDDRAVLRVANLVEPASTTSHRPPTGQGLTGMRERIQAIGGSFDVHRTPTTWTVEAEVRLHDRSRVW
jgi:signal transduction histidine kinase